MEFKILPIIAFLSVAIVVSHAALPSEEYWNSVLPNTPMPKAVKDLLQPTPVYLANHVNDNPQFAYNAASADDNQLFLKRGYNGASSANNNPLFFYRGYNAASATQLHADLFFLERDLFAGNKMNHRFSQSTKNQQTFLPRQLADSIPFSSEKLPAIYSELDVEPASEEAAAIEETIHICEGGDTLKGEEKFCATSLESMIDYSTAVLGKEVTAVSAEVDGGGGERKAYRVAAVKKLTAATVVCHQLEYAYAVFYCHKIKATVAYSVSLVGGGGAKAEAVVVCHRDTAEWDPNYLAFQVLKVKPGTVPICHYLGENAIVWVSKIN